MVNAVKDTRKLKPQLTKKLSFSGSGTMKDWWVKYCTTVHEIAFKGTGNR